MLSTPELCKRLLTHIASGVQVVAHERPDLQEQAASLSTQLASYTITLKELEDNLLQRLAASQVWLSELPSHIVQQWLSAHHLAIRAGLIGSSCSMCQLQRASSCYLGKDASEAVASSQ